MILNKKCSVSPGGFTLKHAQKMEKKLKNQRLRQSLFSSKRRRLELKSQRAMKNCTQSVLEGDTYQSKIGIEEDLDLEDIDPTPVSFPKDGNEIIFDLETTGLARTSDIIQIAAVSAGEEMNIYMTPTTEISIGASAATGLTDMKGKLCNDILNHIGYVMQRFTEDYFIILDADVICTFRWVVTHQCSWSAYSMKFC
uniref:Exonuclease domain-containing protein n=1 Tax=Magallana gigas TaxID=29159 RepID=A0A8W8P3L3_MAGGI